MMVAGFKCDERRAASGSFACLQERGGLGMRAAKRAVIRNGSDAAIVREQDAPNHRVRFNRTVTAKCQPRRTIQQHLRTRLACAGRRCARHSSRRSVAAVHHCLARTSSFRRSGMMR